MKMINVNTSGRAPGISALGFVLAVAMSGPVRAQTVTPPVVPASIEVPAPNQAFLVGHGVGTQN
jgi:hypothetical protein